MRSGKGKRKGRLRGDIDAVRGRAERGGGERRGEGLRGKLDAGRERKERMRGELDAGGVSKGRLRGEVDVVEEKEEGEGKWMILVGGERGRGPGCWRGERKGSWLLVMMGEEGEDGREVDVVDGEDGKEVDDRKGV